MLIMEMSDWQHEKHWQWLQWTHIIVLTFSLQFALLHSWLNDQLQHRQDWLFVTLPPSGTTYIDSAHQSNIMNRQFVTFTHSYGIFFSIPVCLWINWNWKSKKSLLWLFCILKRIRLRVSVCSEETTFTNRLAVRASL